MLKLSKLYKNTAKKSSNKHNSKYDSFKSYFFTKFKIEFKLFAIFSNSNFQVIKVMSLINPLLSKEGYWYGNGKYQKEYELFLEKGEDIDIYLYVEYLNKILYKMYNDGLDSLCKPGKFVICFATDEAMYTKSMKSDYVNLLSGVSQNHEELSKLVEELIKLILNNDTYAYLVTETIIDLAIEIELSDGSSD